MKRILFITHQLSLSGAPIVLLDFIRTVREEGYGVEVLSLTEGPLSGTLDEMEIPWRIKEELLKDWRGLFEELHDYCAVVVNTLVSYPAITLLKHTKIPTIWWLHETEWFFETYDRMPDLTPKLTELPENIHLLSVSPAVQEIIQRRYGIETPVQPFCVPDRPYQPKDRERTVRFLTLASFGSAKGQDVLAEAIRLLPESVRKQCSFSMYGGILQQEPDFKDRVETILSGVEEASVHPAVSHEEAVKLMEDCDFCVIPSREEPFSAVAVDGMVLHKPSILTEVCGVTAWPKDAKNALFCPADNPEALSLRIREAAELYLNRPDLYTALGNGARAVYDAVFSPVKFAASIRDLLKEVGVS